MAGSRKHKTLSLVLSLGLSVGLLAYLLSGLDWAAFFEELKHVNLLYVPLIVFLFFIPFVMRAARWRLLLPNSSKASFAGRFDGLFIGTLATCILPLRAGEFVRPWLLARWEGDKFSTAFASVITERAFDVLGMLLLLVLAFSRIPELPYLVVVGAKSLGIVTFGIVAVMGLAYVKPALFTNIAETCVQKTIGRRSPTIAEKLIAMIHEFVHGLRGISSFYELCLVLLWSALIWFSYALTYHVGLWAFGDSPQFLIGMATTVMVALAIAAPSAPGFVGTFQAGCVAALSGLFHYSREFSVAYSLVLHVINLAMIYGVGFVLLHRRGLLLKDLSAAQAETTGSESFG